MSVAFLSQGGSRPNAQVARHKVGGPHRPAPYCYTNPLPTAVVEFGDLIFVIGNPCNEDKEGLRT